VRLGEEKKKEEDRRKKPQGKNIMVCPVTQGDHNHEEITSDVNNLVIRTSFELKSFIINLIIDLSNNNILKSIKRFGINVLIFPSIHDEILLNRENH